MAPRHDLREVADHDVDGELSHEAAGIRDHPGVEEAASDRTEDPHARPPLLGRKLPEPLRDDGDTMSRRHEPTSDLVDVALRAAGPRVAGVELVQPEDRPRGG